MTKVTSNSLARMVLALGVITVCAGALLGLANAVTAPAIAAMMQQQKQDALSEILPPFDNNPIEAAMRVPVGTDTLTVFPATENGTPVGCAVETTAHGGFSGDFSVIFGFNDKGAVTGYRVLSHSETPGLGAKMGEWFCSPAGHRSVIGQTPGPDGLRLRKDGGDIDGITAATITSRAFLSGLNTAYTAAVSSGAIRACLKINVKPEWSDSWRTKRQADDLR